MERNKKIYLLKQYREVLLFLKKYKLEEYESVEEHENVEERPKVLVLKKNFHGKQLPTF